MKVGIATDHGGFGLKVELVNHLRAAGYEVVDFGACKLKYRIVAVAKELLPRKDVETSSTSFIHKGTLATA